MLRVHLVILIALHCVFGDESQQNTKTTIEGNSRKLMSMGQASCSNSDCKSTWVHGGTTYNGCPWNAPIMSGQPSCEVATFCPSAWMQIGLDGSTYMFATCSPSARPPASSPTPSLPPPSPSIPPPSPSTPPPSPSTPPPSPSFPSTPPPQVPMLQEDSHDEGGKSATVVVETGGRITVAKGGSLHLGA